MPSFNLIDERHLYNYCKTALRVTLMVEPELKPYLTLYLRKEIIRRQEQHYLTALLRHIRNHEEGTSDK